MRRKAILLFLIALMLAVYRIDKKENNSYDKNNYTVVINNITKKEKSIEYKSKNGIFLVKRKNNDENIKIGYKVIFYGEKKDLDNLYIRDFNYGRYLKSCGYDNLIYVKNYKIIGKNKFKVSLGKIKNYIIKINRHLYKENSMLLNMLICGDKSDLDKNYKFTFSDSGTSHIMAISGLHIAILLIFFTILMGEVTSIKKFILWIFVLFSYSFIVGCLHL